MYIFKLIKPAQTVVSEAVVDEEAAGAGEEKKGAAQ
jgi:hypothetical protein